MTPSVSGLFAALVTITFLPVSIVAQSTQDNQSLRPGRAWRVTLAGDLDAMALADRLSAVLHDAHERNASLVLIELAGDRWRTDVVWAMAQMIQKSQIPVVALLQDTRDHRVGAGQLMLATLCDQSWIDPDTRIVSTQRDDLASWADENTDWERVQRELAAAIWLKLYERDGPVLLARPLVDQQDTVWIGPNIGSDESVASRESIITRGVVTRDSSSNGVQAIIAVYEDASFEIMIDPSQLLELKLVGAVERRPAVVVRNSGARSASPRKVDLDSGLNKARSSAWTLLEQLDAIVQDLERLPVPGEPTAQRDRRSIDAQLRRGVRTYQRGRSKLDAWVSTYPEIPNMAAPSSHSRDFAATLAALVKRYEKLKSRHESVLRNHVRLGVHIFLCAMPAALRRQVFGTGLWAVVNEDMLARSA